MHEEIDPADEIEFKCRTVGELIEALKTFPADAVPSSTEPVWDGVRVYQYKGGRVGIFPIERPKYVSDPAESAAA